MGPIQSHIQQMPRVASLRRDGGCATRLHLVAMLHALIPTLQNLYLWAILNYALEYIHATFCAFIFGLLTYTVGTQSRMNDKLKRIWKWP